MTRPERSRPVGLTGGIGSGKSSVARFCCQQFDIGYIDADVVCRDLLRPHAPGWRAFVENFDNKFLAADQTIDRQRLRTAIFQDEQLRKQLDSMIHPLARAAIDTMLSGKAPDRFLIEVPLLYEAGWENDFGAIIVVYSDEACCLERLRQRDRVSLKAAQEAIDAQLPLREKARRADYVVDNSGTWQETCRQALRIGEKLWGKEEQG